MSFVHTHVHSTYSILDSSISPEDLAQEAKAKGMTSMALTDHGNTFGHVEFYKACMGAGIKPILGCEVYVARRSASEPKDPIRGNSTDHLVLLAENNEGYANLLQIVSKGWQRNHFDGTMRVDLEILREHAKGIIGLSACLSGGVQRLLSGWRTYDRSARVHVQIPPNREQAIQLASDLRDIFGQGNFFLEVQHHAGPHQNDDVVTRQRDVAGCSLEIAHHLGIPQVGTNDIHFRFPEDAPARDLAVAISQRRHEKAGSGSLADLIATSGEFYVKSADEMYRAFEHRSDLLENTLYIAERCNVTLELGKYHFATPILDGQEATTEQVQAEWRRLLEVGFKNRMQRVPSEKHAQYRERLEYEIGVIERMGFTPYFLIVADFVNHAKSKGILVGPGRGSAAGALVSYCLRITDVDPIRRGLLFERFLNPDRISMPDIDIDFDNDRVGEVLEYVRQKYGSERVARISAFGAMWARSAIRTVGAALEIDPAALDELAKAIPPAAGDFRVDLKDAADPESPRAVPEVVAFAQSEDPRYKTLIDSCVRLEGINAVVSTHACGIVIGDRPLRDYVALMPVQKELDSKLLQAQADMGALENLGLVKMDFLPLDTLARIAHAERLIKKYRKVDFKADEDTDYEDPKVWELFRSARILGCFTAETNGMRELVLRMKPRNIEDLSAVAALFRPGPLDQVDEHGLTMVDHYILRRNGQEPTTYAHPTYEPILENTHGIIVYQEQIMNISRALCGYTPGEADNLRKGIGKKKVEIIAKEKAKFIPAAMKHSGLTEEQAHALWDPIEKFGRYGFNKSHSMSYAALAYQTMRLKAYYPVEFMAAILSRASGDAPSEFEDAEGANRKDEDVLMYLYECNHMSIPVYEPDVNRSESGFVPEGDGIRAGLSIIQGLAKAGKEVIAARFSCGGRFSTFSEMVQSCVSMGVTQPVLEALIYAGACSEFGHKNQLLQALPIALQAGRSQVRAGGFSFIPPTETIPQAPQLDAALEQAKSIDLLSAYSLPKRLPRSVGVLVNRKEDLYKIIDCAAQTKGEVPLRARVVLDGLDVVMELGCVDSEAFATWAKAQKMPVKVNQ